MTSDQQVDRARLRALAEKATPGPWIRYGVRQRLGDEDCLRVGPDGYAIAFLPIGSNMRTHAESMRDAAYIAAASPDVLLRLLDALDEARRERDEARRHHAENTRLIEKERGRVIDTLRAERDALAADARRWQAIDAHWRTAQCYFRKDATNSIRAVQMFIDFDHRNDGKALGGVVDEAIAALAAREPT